MSYASVLKKLNLSKKRVERFEQSIFKEVELQSALSKELGSIKIENVPVAAVKTVNEDYNRQEVAARVVELRYIQKMSFTTIAVTLNAEGFKPRTAEAFSQATVFQLYKAATKVATASA